jgi:ribonuclease E
MSLLRSAAAWLVEPDDDHGHPAEPGRAGATRLAAPAPAAAPPRSHSAPAVAPLSRLAVVASPTAVAPLAAAVAQSARARAGTPAALVALWRPATASDAPPAALWRAASATEVPLAAGMASAADAPSGAPALPGAAALCARLARRGLPVSARGRLVWLLLPPDDESAVPVLRHAEAAAADAPAVLAVGRPRDETVDVLLAERELVVVAAAPDSPLGRAAAADTAPLRVPIHATGRLPHGLARLAALAGLRAPRMDLPPAAGAVVHHLACRAAGREAG